MSLVATPDEEQGVLFSPKPFHVTKEQIRLAGGALQVNNDDEGNVLRSHDGTEQLLELRVFASVKGFTKEHDVLTWNLVVADAVIDTD